jgi:hypothetical protein
MYIRIINLKKKTERRVHAESVDFDRVNWLITINGQLETFKRKHFKVFLFA